jgi:hypothetical protein
MAKASKQKDDEFIALYRKLGSPTLVARELGINPRSVLNRRASLEIRYGIKLDSHGSIRDPKKEKPKKLPLPVKLVVGAVAGGKL